jgi:transcriptional regulator with XRE-family HTH domain
MARNEAALAFGREVRRRRHAQGLTLDALGEAAGLTLQYVGSIEAGRRDPSISSMTKIAAGLGAPLAEMLGAPEMSAETLEGARHRSTALVPRRCSSAPGAPGRLPAYIRRRDTYIEPMHPSEFWKSARGVNRNDRLRA